MGINLRELSELGTLAACIIEQNGEPLVVWHGDGRLLAANLRFRKLAGYSGDELEGMRWPDDFAVPETRDTIRRAMDDPAGDETPVHHGGLIRKDGSQTEVMIQVHRHRPDDGGEPCYFSFVTDVAGRRKEQAALREAQAHAELLLDLMSNDIDNMQRVSIRYLELALGTARLRPGERELIMTALGSLANASRMIDNVRRVNGRDRPGFP